MTSNTFFWYITSHIYKRYLVQYKNILPPRSWELSRLLMAEKVKASRSSNRRRTFLDNLPFRKLFRRNNTMPEMTTNPDNSKKNEEDNSSGPASSAKEGGKERERPGTPKPSSVTTAGDSGQTSPKPPQPQTAFDSAAALLAQYGYGLGEQLGKGSYAIVRSASSKKHKRRVAIKIISKKKAPEDYLTKFLPREIQVLKRLRHSNCISLLEAIETNTRIYLIMNLAENGDLLEYIRERGPMPDDDARRYFRQLITATDYFHSLGIVHRDLKCENLLLDINHNIVVSDFGFARGQMINPETGKRRLSQTFCGSYAYAPPEILRGIAYDGTVADIWSLGVVLYTMVSASLPFDDSNLKTLLEQVMRQVHFSSRKKISPEVKDLICRMLQPSVEQRATVTEIREHCWFKGEKLPPTKPDEVSEEEGKN